MTKKGTAKTQTFIFSQEINNKKIVYHNIGIQNSKFLSFLLTHLVVCYSDTYQKILRLKKILILIGLLCFVLAANAQGLGAISEPNIQRTPLRINEIDLPVGYQREKALEGSYEAYLQNFPLKEDTLIYLYDGSLKPDQSFGYKVMDIDIGSKNLQQCADAAIRLRAEYLFAHQRFGEIHFKFSSGDVAEYSKWREGYRAEIDNDKVKWIKKVDFDSSYQNFRAYLEVVFNYAGSWSLARELKPVASPEQLAIGDMLVKGAFPGHVMIVVDKAIHTQTQEAIYLLAQSARPAQSIHIVKNRLDESLSPWYSTRAFKTKIDIEEWTFYPENLKRF